MLLSISSGGLDMDITNNDSCENEVSEALRKYNEDKRFTYADYESWDDHDSNGNPIRYELIDGIAYMMSAPTTEHQSILGELHRQFANFLKGKTCRVFLAPCDVCLSGLGDEDDTVVQPDLLVVCDESKLDKKRCNGAPDMVIEILSPSTSKRDLFIKLKKYQNAGVREYWIADPDAEAVNVHILENGRYVINSYESDETIAVTVLEGCVITLPDVF